jgi:hypothetical protein
MRISSWASHFYTSEICGCAEKAGVGAHSTQGIFTCTKLLGINCDPIHYWRSPYQKISESVSQWPSPKLVTSVWAGGLRRRKKFWTLVKPPNSCQFEILRPDLFLSLSLSLSLALWLSLFLLSTQSVAFSCVASLSLSQIEIHFVFINFILTSGRVNPFGK